ncbi:MAG: metalloregulator ArsR/SmtB family transcription factor [Candidatus Thermoplasmatota archaeon]|nr:metalloregulator ArsR/SmtB family transcription factor [Candidatus Thermoplasmatota archaeon]
MLEEARLLKAMADETRLTILRCLINGERCACTLVPATGRAQPTVSRHLKILEEAGILESRRNGSNIWYRLKNPHAKQILDMLGLEPIEFKEQCGR